MSALDRFRLAELSVQVFASPETFADLYRDVLDLLEKKYEKSAWQIAATEDMTDDPEYGDTCHHLRTEAEMASRPQ